MTRDEELESLVRAQHREMGLGAMQPTETFVKHSLDEVINGAPLSNLIEGGTLKAKGWPECPVHGISGMKLRADQGTYECKGCKADWARLKYHTNPVYRAEKIERSRRDRARRNAKRRITR